MLLSLKEREREREREKRVRRLNVKWVGYIVRGRRFAGIREVRPSE
jgi:hypothetical protein